MTTKEAPTLVEVKKNIRALLISAPRGLSVEDIEHDYQAVLGKPLPFKHFKCKTALDFLKTMPDVICPSWNNGILILKGIADESSKHIAKLVARQRVNNSKSRRIFRAPVKMKPLVVPSNFRRNIKELLTVYPNGILGSSLSTTYARHYGEEINFSKLGFKSMSELLNAIQDIATIVKNPRGGYRVCAVARKSRPKTPPAQRNSQSNAPTSKEVPSNTLPSRLAPPKGNPSRALPANGPRSKNEAARSIGAYIVPNKRKPLTDLNSLDGNVSLKKEQRKSEKVKDLLDSKSGISESMKDELISWFSDKHVYLSNVINRDGFSMIYDRGGALGLGWCKILVERPNGVWAARLPFEYKTLIGKDLNVLAMGFYSIIEMASAMPDIFRIERPFPNGDWLLFLAAKSRKDKNITKVHIPENAVGKGLGYIQQSMPDDIIIELYVTHIRTPDCFWVQLLEFVPELEELQCNMRAFYSLRESAQYMVDDSLIKLGQVCVARFPVDHEWYRGLITAMPTPLIVEVFYVDYGNTCQVSKSDIRLMKKEFFQLPSQAIKSKLANVKPKLTIWDPTAAHRMNELTANKPLVGFVSNKKDDVLNVCICDTTGKDDLHISDVLVNEGLAIFKQDNTSKTAPPGFALLEPTQMDINQEINFNATQNTPTFPDYSTFNMYTGFSNFDFASFINMAPAEQDHPVLKEDIAPIIDEEKPTDDDIEFMRQVCEELIDDVSVVVKRLSLPDGKVVHVINFEEKPFVVRSEISALIWDTDILRSKLREAKMVVEKEIISREDHEELFDNLRRLKVGDFASGEEAKEYASLYHLSTVPGILETFNHPSSEVVKMFKDEVAAFEQNPSTYWEAENDTEGTDDSSQSEADEEHDIEELKLAEQALQFTRKRILRAMANGDVIPGESTVNEADDVEKRLAHIRDLIAKAVAKAAAKDSEGSKESKVKQDDKVVVDSGSVGNVVLAKQQEQSVRPVGVTKPEIRQPSNDLNSSVLNSVPRSSDLLVQNPKHLGTHTSDHQYPNLPTSTALRPDIPGSTFGIHSSTPQYPDISTSTAPHVDIPRSISQLTDVPISSALHPNIPTSNPHNPVLHTSTSFYSNPSNRKPAPQIPSLMDTHVLNNPKMNCVNPQSPSGRVGGNMNNDVFRSMDQRGTAANQDAVRPSTSVDNQQPHKNFAESVRKTIEKISLESAQKTQDTQEYTEKFSTNKRPQSSSKPSHLPLPYPGPPIPSFPFVMPGGHVTPLPHMNFPFCGPNVGPNNVPFQGFVGPIHPFTPPLYPELGMQFNAPLSGPSFGHPSQFLFKQYSPPFSNPHGRRTQK